MQTQARTQAQGNEKFSISCVGACACVCVCVVVVHTSICLCLRLRLRLRLHRSCEPALSSLRVTRVLLAELEKFVRIILTILAGLYYLTLLGPISVHATSLRQA